MRTCTPDPMQTYLLHFFLKKCNNNNDNKNIYNAIFVIFLMFMMFHSTSYLFTTYLPPIYFVVTFLTIFLTTLGAAADSSLVVVVDFGTGFLNRGAFFFS